MQVAHHLAAVADAESKHIVALEKQPELFARARVEQDRFRPALSGAQYIAVGKSPAGNEALETRERDPSGNDIRHMNIDGLEAGAVERRGHFHLPVHALLPQDGDLRAHAAGNKRCSDVLRRIEFQFGMQTGIGRIQDAIEFLLRAIRVVAQALEVIRGLRPGPLQGHAGFAVDLFPVRMDDEPAAAVDATNPAELTRQAGAFESILHDSQIRGSDLHHRTELFAE